MASSGKRENQLTIQSPSNMRFIVKARDMTPRQHHTKAGFKRRTDCYERVMLKHPFRSVFHSRAELYYAALLEADPAVTSYVPQPFSLAVSGRAYIPDCYVLRNGQRVVVELKPRGEFDDALRVPLEKFFEQYGMRFQVVANEFALEQHLVAENWLSIISALVQTESLDTHQTEIKQLDQFSIRENLRLGQLIDPCNRIGSLVEEAALFRLLHRGLVQADLGSAPLDYDTEFSLCD